MRNLKRKARVGNLAPGMHLSAAAVVSVAYPGVSHKRDVEVSSSAGDGNKVRFRYCVLSEAVPVEKMKDASTVSCSRLPRERLRMAGVSLSARLAGCTRCSRGTRGSAFSHLALFRLFLMVLIRTQHPPGSSQIGSIWKAQRRRGASSGNKYVKQSLCSPGTPLWATAFSSRTSKGGGGHTTDILNKNVNNFFFLFNIEEWFG